MSYCSPHSHRQIGATKFDTLSIFYFYEYLFPIWYSVFSPASGVLVPISKICLLKYLIEKDGATEVNLLVVLIDVDDHAENTAMNPNLVTCMKWRYMLTAWATESIRRMDSVEKNTAAESVNIGMIVTIKFSLFTQIHTKGQHSRTQNNVNESVTCKSSQN